MVADSWTGGVLFLRLLGTISQLERLSIMNDELWRMCKELDVVYFKTWSKHFLEGLKIPSRTSRFLDQDFNLESPK
jgi:hypothetical protein